MVKEIKTKIGNYGKICEDATYLLHGGYPCNVTSLLFSLSLSSKSRPKAIFPHQKSFMFPFTLKNPKNSSIFSLNP